MSRPAPLSRTGQAPASPALPLVGEIAGLALFTLAGLFTGVYEVLFVPYRIGATIVPISVVLAVASNAVLPRLSRWIRPDTFAAVCPFVGWMTAVFVLSLGSPEGDVFLTGGSGGTAIVGYVLMAAGFATGIFTVLRTASVALSAEREQRRIGPPPRTPRAR